MSQCTIIILGAKGGRPLQHIGRKTILDKQLAQISLLEERVKVIVVGGERINELRSKYADLITVIENKYYDSYNISYSMRLGALKAKSHLLLVYGDLVFNKEVLHNTIASGESCLVYDTKKRMPKDGPGMTLVDGYVTHLNYGLPNLWCKIAYLTGQELTLFKEILEDKRKWNYYGFELLNLVLERGGSFKGVEPKKMKIVEVNSLRDVKKAQKIR